MPQATSQTDRDHPAQLRPGHMLRAGFGGVLMGLANLVPGISGGTMLLAAGVYRAFIESISDVTRLRLRPGSIATLGVIVVAAGLSIVLLAGPVVHAVVHARWVMYSLFIGLTLGGAPLVWRLLRPHTAGAIVAAAAGFLAMAALALAQQRGAQGVGSDETSMVMLGVAGAAAASAMVLPGVSGGYLLLVLGQYVPLLAAIDRIKQAVRTADVGAMAAELGVVIPVGIGVVVGIVGVSNLLRVLLHRFEKPTLGFLLGLLLGAVIGLWPFQRGEAPEPGDVIKGAVLTEDTAAEVDPEDWPLAFFSPTAGQVAGSVALVLIGLGVTIGIARLGEPRERQRALAAGDEPSQPAGE